MPHVLQQLLKRDDSQFSAALHKLEKAVGNEGVDVRLIADITHKAHDVIRNLNLDPADSTGKEVYSVLRSHVKSNDRIEALLAADYVLLTVKGAIVSFNLIDILDDIREGRGFEDRSLEHGRRALMGEIIHRYTSHARTHDPMVRSLLQDGHFITEENNNTKIVLPPIARVQSIT